MTVQISAIVCTFNRASYLRKAIQSLIEQTLDKNSYEILVVDNCSTDETKQVVKEFVHVPNLRYLYEPIQGLSQARNTGWQNAKGKYVAYLDDDAIAHPKWLERILEVFETVTPQPGVVGGKIEPIWEAPRPSWLLDSMDFCLSILDLSKDTPIISYDRQLYAGANSAFPRELILKVGGFQVTLGRKGSKLLSQEEILFWKQLQAQGYCCYYDPLIVVHHHIPSSRLTKKWILKRMYWEGTSEALLEIYLDTLNLKQRLKMAISKIKTLSKFGTKRKLTRLLIEMLKTENSPPIFEQKCQIWMAIGYIMGILGLAV